METLLEFYLFKDADHFEAFKEHQKMLENRLRRFGTIERNKINFSLSQKVTHLLISSTSKLNGIKEIVDFEYQQLGKNLRLVILADFIRKDFFVNSTDNTLELNKIGVIPIFEKLRRNNINRMKIGVLTGSLVILPKSACKVLKEKENKYHFNPSSFYPVPFDHDFIAINQTEQLKDTIVSIVTQIFQSGEIEVLIGTKSLLGEGWDAPAINSLILASFVGSFVLSNQMRGRAIRTQNSNPQKTSNIWHLVCIDPTSIKGGDDFDLLKRRFRSFVGVSFNTEPDIENGIGRLNILKRFRYTEDVENKNRETFKAAAARELLTGLWKTALDKGVNLVEEIKIPFPEDQDYRKVKKLYYSKTVAYVIAELFAGLLAFGKVILQDLANILQQGKISEYFLPWLSFMGFVFLIIFGRQIYTSSRLYIKYRDIANDIQKIGEALLNSLIKERSIRTDISRLYVKSSLDVSGSVYCHLEGGTTFEKSIFINTLREIIGPIGNPRYVIIRKNIFLLLVNQKDYHAVPEKLGRNKKLAEYFEYQWQSLVGSCELVYTRTISGRKLLLEARVKSLVSQFEDHSELINKWR